MSFSLSAELEKLLFLKKTSPDVGLSSKAIIWSNVDFPEPDLILADEPTGSLDSETAKEVFSLFAKLKSKNRSILYATHNRELSNKADYKLNIIDGNIIRENEFSY